MSAAVASPVSSTGTAATSNLPHVCSFCGALDVAPDSGSGDSPSAQPTLSSSAQDAAVPYGALRVPSSGSLSAAQSNPFASLSTRASAGAGPGSGGNQNGNNASPSVASPFVSSQSAAGAAPGAGFSASTGFSSPPSSSRYGASHGPSYGLRAAIISAIRNFGIGVGLKVAVALLQHLISGRAPSSLSRVINSQSLRFGLFLGGFAGMYKGLHTLIHSVLPQEKGHLPSFVSGAVAASSIFFLRPSDRPSIAVYLFVRAMAILAHGASHQAWYPAPLKRFQHGDTALLCLSACQILFAYIYEQDTLPPSYLKFLLMAGGKTKPTIDSVAFTGRGLPIAVDAINKDCAARKIPQPDWAKILHPVTQVALTQAHPGCDLLHPGQSCGAHYVSFAFKHFFQIGLRFYLPLNLTSILIFRGKDVFRVPTAAAKNLIRSCVRSAAFLALYCANAWAMCCLLRRIGCLNGLSTWLFVGPAAGLSVLLEAKARRLELAIYCMSPALQSWYKCIRKWGWVPKIHYVDYMFFALAMGVIMSAMQNNPRHMLTNYPSLSKIMKSMIGIEM